MAYQFSVLCPGGMHTNFFHLFYRFLFWAPLCLLGIPPAMVLFFESITAIQNFLVHTDKLGKIGTYAPEIAPPIYGITHHLNTHNPYQIVTHEYARLLHKYPKIKGFTPKLRYFFSPPQ